MKTIAIIAVVGIAAAVLFSLQSSPSTEVENEFRAFLDTYRVGYGSTEEFSYRLGVFQENLNRIAQLRIRNPLATFGVNKFADRTPEEMKKLRGYKSAIKASPVVADKVSDVPTIDWSGIWGSVKDQGQCGSCWAFSATAAFEARYAFKQGQKTVSTLFSEQELVDCDKQSEGCNGGLMDYAFEYLEKSGFCTEDQYPYVAYDQKCKASKCSKGQPTDTGYTDITPESESAVFTALAEAPLSVAVDAEDWSYYTGGIFSDCGTDLDHGVTLVGAGKKGNQSYVLIRNSWAGDWGENGHIRLAAGDGLNTCGYLSDPSVPTF